MKMLKIILYFISFVILIFVAFFSGLEKDKFYLIILCAISIILPATYSIIPLIKEVKFSLNKDKNRLSDMTFTDRNADVNNILKMLATQEHILEIKGASKGCGKTWLAKKVFDCINHPKDVDHEKYVKCPYHKAHYIDMKDKNDEFLNLFFENNIISRNTVLIFDHVTDISAIISKQERYHFQLIYILEEKQTSIEPFLHRVSEFDVEYINDLHKKIRKNYPSIECISSKETQTLYLLTNGNIGKITSLLSCQEGITWIRNKAQNQATGYEMELDIIETELFCGHYLDAKLELSKFKKKYESLLYENNDLYFKYYFMKSDCEHLLNNYHAALSILEILFGGNYSFNNIDYKLELKKAHYLKHLWKCNDSIEVLQQIQKKNFTAIVDQFGILLAKYFIDDLYVPNSEKNSLENFLDLYSYARNSSMVKSESDLLKLNRYYAIYNYYTDCPSEETPLLEIINPVIEIYKAQNNRLLANILFIKAEIFRLYKKYDEAEKYYQKTLSITNDNNIKIQVGFMRYYLFKIKHIDTTPIFEIMSKEKLFDLVNNENQKNKYGEILFRRINSMELQDPNYKKIIDNFNHRIMPIL